MIIDINLNKAHFIHKIDNNIYIYIILSNKNNDYYKRTNNSKPYDRA